MPLSNSLDSYTDLREYLDSALDSERGVKVTVSTPGKAVHMRQRLYKLRLLDRAKSMEIYTEGDSEYGRSIYDSLEFTVSGCDVLIQPATTPVLSPL